MPLLNYPVAYDWFAPSASVTLLDEKGNKFPLWMTSDELRTNAPKVGLKAKHLAVFREVTVDWQGAFYQITVQLCPEYEDAQAILESDLIIQGSTCVEVKMGLATGGPNLDSTFQVFLGRVINVQFSLGTEINLTLKAVPTASWNAQNGSGSDQLNDTRLEVIKKMWAMTGGAKVDDRLVDTTSGNTKKLLEEKVSVAQAGKSPMTIIKDMLEQSMCFQLLVDKTLVILPRKTALIQPPVAKFEVFITGGKLGGGPGGYVFPILSCSSNSEAIFARRLYGAATTVVDPKKKTAMQVEIDERNRKFETEAASLGPAKSKGGKVGRGPTPEVTAANVESMFLKRKQLSDQRDADIDKIQKKYEVEDERQRFNQGIELKVDSLFLPSLVPFTVVNVKGLSGRRMDGNYLITKVVHRVGMDGGMTSWEGRHNGTYNDATQEPAIAKIVSKDNPNTADGKTEITPIAQTINIMEALRTLGSK